MVRDSTSKLYFGNLPPQTTDEHLKEFLNQNGVTHNYKILSGTVFQSSGLMASSNYAIKRGYAFIECQDQATADILIDGFQGRNFMGNLLTVEPAFRGPRSEIKITPRLVVSNCSEETTAEDIEMFFSNWGGSVTSVEKVGLGVYIATFPEDQHMEEILEDCKGVPLCDAKVNVESAPLHTKDDRYRNTHNRSRNNRYVFRPSDFPLRLLIPAEYIGAIIGRGGVTIRGITHDTGARVDVYRSNGSRQTEVEKVITILGSTDNCSTACKRILELLAQEASAVAHNHHGPIEISLKMLCCNSLVGRVIGKQGINIKKIMHDTQTKIHVSNQSDYTRRYLTQGVENSDRIITIRGSIEGMCNAESLISSKMKTAYEVDYQLGLGQQLEAENVRHIYQTPAPQAVNNGLIGESPFLMTPDSIAQTLFHNLSMRNNVHNGANSSYGRRPYQYDNQNMVLPGRSYGYEDSKAPGGVHQIRPGALLPEKTYLYIPSNFVGAVIGNRGGTIRTMIRESGASLKIENSGNDGPLDVVTERRVTIFGPLEAHWKAQFLLFQKLTEDGRLSPDLKLTLEMGVPSEFVGRLIGRGGMRIKDIQVSSGANVKFLTDEAVGNETFAQLFGTFHELYNAQLKIRHVMTTIRRQKAYGERLENVDGQSSTETEKEQEKSSQEEFTLETLPQPEESLAAVS